jgi:hypothetical protein
VLRVETTLGNPGDLLVFRRARDQPDGKLGWRPIRKGVADLFRRAEICQRSNERYLDALSVVDDSTTLAALLDEVAKPVSWRDRRVRALRTGDPADVALLGAISRGELATAGFRNRDIRLRLPPETSEAAPPDVRRIAARVGRQIRLLRAHGLVQKIPQTHRYQLTAKGHALTAALTAARTATLKQLLREAALNPRVPRKLHYLVVQRWRRAGRLGLDLTGRRVARDDLRAIAVAVQPALVDDAAALPPAPVAFQHRGEGLRVHGALDARIPLGASAKRRGGRVAASDEGRARAVVDEDPRLRVKCAAEPLARQPLQLDDAQLGPRRRSAPLSSASATSASRPRTRSNSPRSARACVMSR